MPYERLGIPNKKKFRNLTQYRNMSDDEFDELWDQKMMGIEHSNEFEGRIEKKINDFSKDYDIDDLKINDRLTLRALAQAMLSLEDYEQHLYAMRKAGVGYDNIAIMEKVTKIMSDLRADISKMQDDLKIVRKTRKGDKEESVVAYISSLNKKAKEMYESRMSYIFCPECKTLLGTIWTLYPNEKKNKVVLFCPRDLGDGQKCNTRVIVGTAEMIENHGVNIQEVPEFFK